MFVAWKGIPMEDIETNYFDFQVYEKLLFTTRGAKKDLALEVDAEPEVEKVQQET